MSAHCLNGLGLVAIDAERSDEAEELLKTAVAICEVTRNAQAREVILLDVSFTWIEATGPGQGHIRRESQLCPSQPRRSGRWDVIAPVETAGGHRPRRDDPGCG